MHRLLKIIDPKNIPTPVLVTGAGGFVGGYVVRFLHKFNIPVVAMVRFGSDYTELKKLGINCIEADLVDADSLKKAVVGIKSIVHIAALFRKAGLPDSSFKEVNEEGTRSLLDAAVNEGVERFIHCSTVGVHSHIVNPPADENTPYSPADIYQSTKAEGEKIALEYMKSGKIKGVVIRPAMIYGPADQRTLKLFKAIAKKRFLFIGPCTANVHFIDVRDLTRAFVLALAQTHINNEVFIISGAESVSIKEVANRIAKIMNVKLNNIHIPVKPIQMLGSICETICEPLKIQPPIFRRRVDFFVKNRHFTSKKAETMLGFKSTLTLDQELEEIIRWYTSNGWLSKINLGGNLRINNSDLNNDLQETVELPSNNSNFHPFNPVDLKQINQQINGDPDRHINSEFQNHEKVARILRTFDGFIKHWNAKSESIYGWDSFHATGRISHLILNTRFPETSLDLANQALLQNGVWNGKLLHTKKDNTEILVNSSWRMFESHCKNFHFVEEINIVN